MQKDIILGGSFDPIHVAHITIAHKARSVVGARYVYFIPTRQNPLKNPTKTSSEDRLTMLQLATKHLPWVKILTYELDLPEQQPVYTIDTIERLYNDNILSSTPYLLLGDDIFTNLEQWHRIDDLMKLVNLLVVTRDQNTNTINYPFRAIQIPPLDISSSAIRKNIQQANKLHHLHPAVWEYIDEKNLYC